MKKRWVHLVLLAVGGAAVLGLFFTCAMLVRTHPNFRQSAFSLTDDLCIYETQPGSFFLHNKRVGHAIVPAPGQPDLSIVSASIEGSIAMFGVGRRGSVTPLHLESVDLRTHEHFRFESEAKASKWLQEKGGRPLTLVPVRRFLARAELPPPSR